MPLLPSHVWASFFLLWSCCECFTPAPPNNAATSIAASSSRRRRRISLIAAASSRSSISTSATASESFRSNSTSATVYSSNSNSDDTSRGSVLLDAYLALDAQAQAQQYMELQQRQPQALALAQQRVVVNEGEAYVAVVDAETKTKDKDEKAINTARLLVLAAAALYGTNFSFVKLLGQADMSVGAISTLRFGMAALATLPFLILPPKDEGTTTTTTSTINIWERPSVAAALAGFEVGMWNSIGYVGQAVGLETTPASESAFLCSLAVVVVPLLDMMAGKRLLPKQATGALLALVGVAILELGPGGGQAHEVLHQALTPGDFASLIQPFAFGMGFYRMERAMRLYPNQAMRSTAAQLMAVFMASVLYTQVMDPNVLQWSQLQQWVEDPVILLGLFWTGVVATALTIYMETVALETLSAAETTLILSTEPLWGTACAALVMGEQLHVDAAVGAVLIVVGCIFSNLGIDGIKSLFSPQDNTSKSKKRSFLPSTPRRLARQTTLLKTGLAAAVGSSTANAWNQMSVGAKVTMNQLEDFLQDVLPWLVDN